MTNLSRELGGGFLKYKVDIIPLLERVDELGVAKLIVSVESVGGGGERSWLEVKPGDLITGTHFRTCSSKSDICRWGLYISEYSTGSFGNLVPGLKNWKYVYLELGIFNKGNM